MEDELRRRFGDAQVDTLRQLLIHFVERHGGGDELGARRWRFSDPSCGPTRSKSGMGTAGQIERRAASVPASENHVHHSPSSIRESQPRKKKQ
jgi:hypothetical protein